MVIIKKYSTVLRAVFTGVLGLAVLLVINQLSTRTVVMFSLVRMNFVPVLSVNEEANREDNSRKKVPNSRRLIRRRSSELRPQSFARGFIPKGEVAVPSTSERIP